ncbi:gastrula zinc finger protein XlCGF28.1-like [Silurus asotus]|uniref:Gastrula zinc finger protein XlCGF28.1-like n=1 Tax=Silurus asotus TaxID=30991 RepID=A0AAD5B6K2_SILAS|nr:gastrula zinc finger protein XlCGF28.1-like [Silurus asotus]
MSRKLKNSSWTFGNPTAGDFPVNINGTDVEQVYSFKFLGVHISEDLPWHQSTSALVRKAQQRLYFLPNLKKAHLSPGILTSFYRCIIESTNSITVWYGGSTVCECMCPLCVNAKLLIAVVAAKGVPTSY